MPKYFSSLTGEKHVGLESICFIHPIYDALVEEGFDVTVARKIVSNAFWMLKRNLTYEELAHWKTDWGGSPDLE